MCTICFCSLQYVVKSILWVRCSFPFTSYARLEYIRRSSSVFIMLVYRELSALPSLPLLWILWLEHTFLFTLDICFPFQISVWVMRVSNRETLLWNYFGLGWNTLRNYSGPEYHKYKFRTSLIIQLNGEITLLQTSTCL